MIRGLACAPVKEASVRMEDHQQMFDKALMG